MDQKNLKKGVWAAGGVALLAVTSALCVKGLKLVDKKLKARKETEEIEAEEAELFAESAEPEVAEETAEEFAAEEKADETAEATE